jgi:magnesium transporter
MSDKPDIPVLETDDPDIQEDDAYGLSDEFVRKVEDSIEDGTLPEILTAITELHYSDLADLIERLTVNERLVLVDAIKPELDPFVLTELDERVRDSILDEWENHEIAAALTELDSDDALYLIEDLDEEEQREILDSVPEEERADIEKALAYPEHSAGRLMQQDYVAVPSSWTVGQVIDFARNSSDLPDDFYDIFILDPEDSPLGTIPLSRVLRTVRQVDLSEIMEKELHTIPADLDQEEVAFIFRQQDLTSAPVVDEDGAMVGVIHIDDVVDVIDEEAEEDLMRLGGVAEDDLYHAVIDTTKSRFTWLLVNLGTAILASLVIGVFDATIEQIVALAVLMPIVASMGGNAGTQTLTVAVRAIATKELTSTNAMRIVGKEVFVGGINGVLFAVLAGLIAWGWFGSGPLALIIGVAMVVNMVIAGLFGVGIPVVLDRLKIDPAIASSVFLTTVTDVIGFFSFLGMAAFFLL